MGIFPTNDTYPISREMVHEKKNFLGKWLKAHIGNHSHTYTESAHKGRPSLHKNVPQAAVGRFFLCLSYTLRTNVGHVGPGEFVKVGIFFRFIKSIKSSVRRSENNNKLK